VQSQAESVVSKTTFIAMSIDSHVDDKQSHIRPSNKTNVDSDDDDDDNDSPAPALSRDDKKYTLPVDLAMDRTTVR
jgi:hypothetical protein